MNFTNISNYNSVVVWIISQSSGVLQIVVFSVYRKKEKSRVMSRMFKYLEYQVSVDNDVEQV